MSVISTILNSSTNRWDVVEWEKGKASRYYCANFPTNKAAVIAAARLASNHAHCLFSQERQFVSIERDERFLHAVRIDLPEATSREEASWLVFRVTKIQCFPEGATFDEILKCAQSNKLPCVPNFFMEPDSASP
jgi:hypothetical protein